MAFMDFLFDNDYRQGRDIEAGKDANALTDSNVKSLGAELSKLRETVRELSATTHVLLQLLVENHGLDLEVVKTRLKAELGTAKARTVPAGATCAKCGAKGEDTRLVKVGAAYWCRPCAANP